MEKTEKLIKKSQNSSTLGVISLGLLALTFLSGCEMGENEHQEKGKKNTIEQNTNIDAQVETALTKYITDNKVAFGKQVIEAANAAQAEEQKAAQAAQQKNFKNVPAIRNDEYVLGNKDSDIVMFEYSDLHCPYCKAFHPTTHELVKTDDVAVVFRALPLVHADSSTPIHEMSECIGAKNGAEDFWKFTDYVFKTGDKVKADNLEETLSTLNIKNASDIVACFKNGDMKAKVQASIEEGRKLGINGTPTTIIKNVKTGEIKVSGGAYPIDKVREMIATLRK